MSTDLIYPEKYINTIIAGDNMDALPNIPDNTVDLIVTDPPYALNFMGKKWDAALPPVETWKECLRVLKPGAFAFIMCTPRQDCMSRMIINLEDAGFMVNFSPIFWTYGTGFPKAANVGKLIDKRLGAERKDLGESPNWRESKRDREKNGSMEVRGQNAGRITAPATPEAKAFNGSYCGLQLKPALEVVLVAMKPLEEKTYIDQALGNGKGVTWLDDGRIPYSTAGDKEQLIAEVINITYLASFGFITGNFRFQNGFTNTH